MSEGKKGRPPKKREPGREFATLYVNGPDGLKGDWQAVERYLKREFTVAEVRDFIIGEGGLPPASSLLSQELEISGYSPEPDEQLPDTDWSVVAKKMATAKTDDDWQSLADLIQPTAVAIMSGAVKGSAAQTSLIKTVWDRAYGKTSAKDESSKEQVGIMLLPVLGDKSEMKICPRCKYALEQVMEKKEDG